MSTLQQSLPKPLAKLGPWAIVACAAILGGLMLPSLLLSESAASKPSPKVEANSKSGYLAPAVPDMPSPQALLGRLAMGTVFVLGLAVVSIYGAKRWLKLPSAAGSASGELKLMETLPLGNRCALHLVHLGKREVLVAVDAGGIKTVVPLADSFEEVLSDSAPPALLRDIHQAHG